MSAPLEPSSRLLNSRLVARPASNPNLVAAYESGTVCTQPARKRPEPKPGQLPPLLARLIGPQGETRRQKRVRDRAASRGRKRTIGRSGVMPHRIRSLYTEGEAAALAIIALEHKRRGKCDWHVAQIAARAGVSVRTVQYALATAKRYGHVAVEYRKASGMWNKASVFTITDEAWLAWLKRGPSLSSMERSMEENSGCKELHTMKKGDLYSDTFMRGGAQNRPGQPSGGAEAGQGVREQRPDLWQPPAGVWRFG